MGFVVSTGKELFDSKRMKQLKAYIAGKSALFGRSLSDVTHLTVDLISDTALSVKRHDGEDATTTSAAAAQASEKIGERIAILGQAANKAVDRTGSAARHWVDEGKPLAIRSRPRDPDD